MKSRQFNEWLVVRNNNINELFGWFKKKEPDLTQHQYQPDDPAEIDKLIYNNAAVKKYTDIVLKHLGIEPGIKLQKIDPNNNPVGAPFQLKNIEELGSNFIQALQRFVAGHIVGGATEKSFLRISHYDAIVIIRTLDQLSFVDPSRGYYSIADESHVNDPQSLSNWLQTKVPVAPDAILQQGYGQGSQEFAIGRISKGHRGDPMMIPIVKKLTDTGVETVKWAKSRGSASAKIGKNLWKSIGEMEKILSALTRKPIEGYQQTTRNKPSDSDPDQVVGNEPPP